MKIWVVVNVTPDSFYAGSRFNHGNVLQEITNYVELNVDKIDIGAESSRPGAKEISIDEEWERLYPVLQGIKKTFGLEFLRDKISVDSRKEQNIEKCLDFGVGTINDISGGSEKIYSMISSYEATYVLMHMAGLPEDMQNEPSYEDVSLEVESWLLEKTKQIRSSGVKKEKVLWDPGIGFGKTLDHNLALIKNVETLKSHGHELLYGISRKSMFKDLLGLNDPDDRMLPSIIGQVILSMKGVENLRVHDAREMIQARAILERFL